MGRHCDGPFVAFLFHEFDDLASRIRLGKMHKTDTSRCRVEGGVLSIDGFVVML